MQKLGRLILDEPVLYLIGILAAVSYGLIGFFKGGVSGIIAYTEAANVLFWLYLTFAIPVGAYMLFCNLIALIVAEPDHSEYEDEVYPSSMEEIIKGDPKALRIAMAIWEQPSRSDIIKRLLRIFFIFTGFPSGAYFLREFAADDKIVLWKMILAAFSLIYGLIMHHRYNR